MAELVRFSISMDRDLLERFDQLIERRGYTNRSEAVRDLVRDALVRQAWEEKDREVAGTITLVYDHHKHELADRLTDVQHKFLQQIVASLHVHLDKDNCLEVLAVRGRARDIQQIADILLSHKGVKHGRLVTTCTGKHLP